MSTRVYPDLVQGTDEWLQARAGLLTASTIGQLLTPAGQVAANDKSRALTYSLLAERLTGFVEPTFVSADMERGNFLEPLARQLYADTFDVTVDEVGLIVREEGGFKVGYSPDGLVGDNGLIEIKAPRQKAHLKTILDDAPPTQYMAQLQTGLFVTGREWIDFISYCGGMPLFVQRVFPLAGWQQSIERAAEKFESELADFTVNFGVLTSGAPVPERIDFDLYEMEF